MKKLIETKKFNSGKRPSEHNISENAFSKDNGGSIAHNLFELEPIDEKRDVRLPHSVLSFSNTNSNDFFFKKCREKNIIPHPARMHSGLVSFFIEFLTDIDDFVLDPFAGSNTTGYIAEKLKRKWVSVEINEDYAHDSIIRFDDPELNASLKINPKKIRGEA
jgi:site-specific DNA-methyltransferase (cytosine-N4-specific)